MESATACSVPLPKPEKPEERSLEPLKGCKHQARPANFSVKTLQDFRRHVQSSLRDSIDGRALLLCTPASQTTYSLQKLGPLAKRHPETVTIIQSLLNIFPQFWNSSEHTLTKHKKINELKFRQLRSPQRYMNSQY